MDPIIEKAKIVGNCLENLPEMQEFLKLKALFENDKSLKELRENIAKLESEDKQEEKQNLLEIYNSNPLVSNYYQVREEVIKILNEIRNELSD